MHVGSWGAGRPGPLSCGISTLSATCQGLTLCARGAPPFSATGTLTLMGLPVESNGVSVEPAAPCSAPKRTYVTYNAVHDAIVGSKEQLKSAGWGSPDYLVAIAGGERDVLLAVERARKSVAATSAPLRRAAAEHVPLSVPAAGGLIPARVLRSVLRSGHKGCATIKARCFCWAAVVAYLPACHAASTTAAASCRSLRS